MRRACLIAAAVAVGLVMLLQRGRSEPARSAVAAVPAAPDAPGPGAGPAAVELADDEPMPGSVADDGGHGVARAAEAREVAIRVLDARDGNPIPDVLVYESREPGDWVVDFEPGDRIPAPTTLERDPRRTDSSGHLLLGGTRA